jgi:anthranilate phosphoribosyltransferase
VAEALRRLGAVHALVVHAAIGMDEISPNGPTLVWEVLDGQVSKWTLDPATVGLAADDLSDLAGGEPAENAVRLERILDGADRKGSAARAAVLLNAAAALYVAGRRLTFAEAARCADETVRTGRAIAALNRLRKASK